MSIHKLYAIALGVLISFSSSNAQTVDFRSESVAWATPAEVKDASSAITTIEALRSNLGGKLNVRVIIDAAGNVSSVETVAGPGSICPTVMRTDVVSVRENGRSAALTVKFSPAKINGLPTTSKGWLYFDLGPEKPEKIETGTNYQVAGAADAPREFTVAGPPPNYVGPVVKGDKVAPLDTRTFGADSGDQKTLSGGVLNGKAMALPKPPYPPAARAVRATGAVSIQVLIETDGTVFSAEAISGHPLLRSASRIAACEARFSQTILEGNPVKVLGIITYNFVP